MLYIIRKSADNMQNIQFIYNNSNENKQTTINNCINCITNKVIDGEVTIKQGEFSVTKCKNV